MFPARHLSRLLGTTLLALGGCQGTPAEFSETSAGSETSSSSDSTGSSGSTGSRGTSTSAVDTTGVASGSASSEGSSGGSSSGSERGTTTTATDPGTSSSGGETTGGISNVGCSDGAREALLDPLIYSDIAACGGGFDVPGVADDTPTCDRQGGDDGPLPDGVGCSIDDLCAEGWHLCTSQGEVSAAGIGDCDAIPWNTGFFATQQSGEGSNTCDPTGTNDVFGCGDVGYDSISGCAPLNRSTGNLCVELMGPWSCPDANDEVGTLVKTGPDFGGALCCRD